MVRWRPSTGGNGGDERSWNAPPHTLRWTYRGTHRGVFQGTPPTGKPVTLTGISVWRFDGTQIVENWHELDTLGLLQQLGALPASAQVV